MKTTRYRNAEVTTVMFPFLAFKKTMEAIKNSLETEHEQEIFCKMIDELASMELHMRRYNLWKKKRVA